uniref:SCP domain-containing protein n=1 Tax=Strongyloides papillosus TaxID=174720 RepID=A0A0N5B296_STREA
MFLCHLLYYTIFIILFLKADVLLGDIKKSGSSGKSKVKVSKSGDATGKISKHGGNIDLDGENVATFIPSDSPKKGSKKKSQFRQTLRKKPDNQDLGLDKLERYVEKFSLSGVKKKVHFGDDQVRTFHSGDPPIKVGERDKYVRYGGKEIRTFNPNDPTKRFNKDQRFWYRYILGRRHHDQKYHGFRVEKLLKRYSLSSKIWYHVWGRCKRVDCYSKHNFAKVYGMFFREINLYRKLHKSVPLKYDRKLAMEALQEATKCAKARTLINVKKYRYSTLQVIYNVLYVPITIYKWYREISMYDFKANVVIPQAEHFSILIWANTTRIGIGIARNEDDVYMVFKFYPEGNQNYRFKENVHKPAYNRFNFKM